jgi:predicted amidophosphoribosyltransferase
MEVVFEANFLYCEVCRKKGDDAVVGCSDCRETPSKTIKFVLFGPHDDAYGT